MKLFGEANQYNTEIGERLHIDLSKDAFAASNKKKDSFLDQMCGWAHCREDARKRPVDSREHDAIEFTDSPTGGYHTLPELSHTHHAAGIFAELEEFFEQDCMEQWNDRYPHDDPPEFPKLRINMKFPVTRDVAYAMPERNQTTDDPDDVLEARFSPVLVKKDEVARPLTIHRCPGRSSSGDFRASILRGQAARAHRPRRPREAGICAMVQQARPPRQRHRHVQGEA